MSTKRKEYKGKSIDDAIAAACSDLKSSREELAIEIVFAGSAGIFGLCKKKAVILASRKAASQAGGSEPCPPEGETPAIKSRPHAKPTREQARPSRSGTRRDLPSPEADEAEAKTPTSEVLAEIKTLTQTLLQLMGYPREVSIDAKGNKVTAHIKAEGEAEAIIGRDGGTLDAIQYLLRKIITQRYPDKIVLTLDAGTYREDREKELVEMALVMARKVKESGKSQMMSALNPAERRIVHVTLQDDAAIRSSSIGEGLFKKVRIYLPGKGRKRSSSQEARGEVVEPEA